MILIMMDILIHNKLKHFWFTYLLVFIKKFLLVQNKMYKFKKVKNFKTFNKMKK